MTLKKATSIVALTALIVGTSRALPLPIGPALPVIDASNLEENLLHTIKLIAQLAEMKDISSWTKNHWKDFVDQTEWIHGRIGRYRTPPVIWNGTRVGNNSERLNDWIGAINAGIRTAEAWYKATVPVTHYPGGWPSVPPNQRTNRQVDLAGIDLADGVAAQVMDTIGRIRNQRNATDTIIRNLTEDSLSDVPLEQRQAAAMQKANAISLAQTQEQVNANAMVAALAEMQLLQMKAQRDAAAKAYNNEVARQRDGADAWNTLTSGFDESMRSFRLPQ